MCVVSRGMPCVDFCWVFLTDTAVSSWWTSCSNVAVQWNMWIEGTDHMNGRKSVSKRAAFQSHETPLFLKLKMLYGFARQMDWTARLTQPPGKTWEIFQFHKRCRFSMVCDCLKTGHLLMSVCSFQWRVSFCTSIKLCKSRHVALSASTAQTN